MRISLLTLLFVPLIAFADGGLPTSPYIYVVGSAEAKKPADMVNIRFQVVGREVDHLKANEQLQTKSAKVLALLDSRKVDKGDLLAYGISSQPVFEQEQDTGRGHGKVIGYTVTRDFELRYRDMVGFSKL